MHNWSTDIEKLKRHPKQYAKWRLEHLVNFGLDKEKINREELKKYWGKLSLDPKKRRFLSFLLWGNKS